MAADQLHAFAPPAGDVSVDYLRYTFGAVIDALQAGVDVQGNQTVLGAMMGEFNYAVLFLGMLFVMYTTIKATLDSAHDGQLLGKSLSEIWVPIRTVIGTSLLLPLQTGFSILQMAVLWLALQGVGVADRMWDVAMDKLAIDGTLGYVSVPNPRALAATILRGEVCMAAMNQQFIGSNSPTRIVLVKDVAPMLVNGNAAEQLHWREQPTTRINPDTCGALTWQENSQADRSESSAAAGPILAAHAMGIEQMVNDLRPVAEAIVNNKGTLPKGVIESTAAKYHDLVQAAAKQAVDASPELAKQVFIKSAKEGGWIYAGTWYNNMTRINDSIQAAVNALPIAQPATIDRVETAIVLQNYEDAMAVTDEYIKDRANAPDRAYDAEVADASSVRSMSDVWRLFNAPAMLGIKSLTERLAGANTSPLGQLRAIGNDMIGIGIAVKTVHFALAGVASSRVATLTVGNVFEVGEALKTLQGTVDFVTNSLWTVGTFLAWYLPAIPAIFWISGVTRWLVSVVEAILASPLMAAMTIHPSGDELVGRAGPGYMLILAMVMQPALLLFALVLSVLMTYPLGWFVNHIFLSLVDGITADSTTGLVAFVALCGLYLVMMVFAMHGAFALIQTVPDNVMKFVAAQAGAANLASADKPISSLENNPGGGGGHNTGDVLNRRTDKQDPRGKSGEPNEVHLGG